jgi:hypothetical protein
LILSTTFLANQKTSGRLSPPLWRPLGSPAFFMETVIYCGRSPGYEALTALG